MEYIPPHVPTTPVTTIAHTIAYSSNPCPVGLEQGPRHPYCPPLRASVIVAAFIAAFIAPINVAEFCLKTAIENQQLLSSPPLTSIQ